MISTSTSRLFIRLGAISGFLSVGLGAFGAHALKSQFTEYQLRIYHTAVDYQFYHALGLVLIGILLLHFASKQLAAAGWLMLAGTVLFSGSLYLLAVSSVKWLGMITPLGGLCFLLGWAFLAVSTRSSRK